MVSKLYKERIQEINDAVETVCILTRAEIERLCNNGEYTEALKLEGALEIISKTVINSIYGGVKHVQQK